MIIEPRSVVIRPAVLRDRNRLRAMQATSMRDLGAAFYTPEEIEAFLTYVGTMDDSLLEERTYYVAEDPFGRLVASGGWSRRRANYVDSGTPGVVGSGRAVPKVRSFFVHPAWARRGIGSRLMRRTEEEIRAAGFNEIEVNATLSGVPFYRRLCYQPVRRLDIALPDGIVFTGAVLRRRLAEACGERTELAAA